jgi:hypothetical protein
MLLVEAILAVLALIIALAWPTLGASWFERVEARFRALARRPHLAMLAIGAATLLLRIAVLPVEPIPSPSVHDEFSYLLQADTFAHGRLTNPTPAMWVHFETFHEIFQPTYCSKFFPGQGLFLALGKVVFGHPFWGVWLTSGLMCAAITWMLQGWFSAEWALLGGALALLRFGVFGYWANSYWGGNVPAIGGALVLGALPRIKSSVRWQDATLMGIGLALLANTRPWEGLVLSLPVAVMLFWWMLSKSGPPIRVSLQVVVLPLTIVLGLTGGWLAYYCWRTTANPLRTPYQVYEQTYASVPFMRWQRIRPEPEYRHAILRKLNSDQNSAEYHISEGVHLLRMLAASGFFFLGPILVLPFILISFVLPVGLSFLQISSRSRIFFSLLVFSIAATELVVFYNPHYSAPATALFIALIVSLVQRARMSGDIGLFLSRGVFVACALAFLVRIADAPLRISKSRYSTYYFDEFRETNVKGWFDRPGTKSLLERNPGQQVVIVRYGPHHELQAEWVYNDADINQAKIIWARDMGSVANLELLNHYKGRHAWLLEADAHPPTVIPYLPNADLTRSAGVTKATQSNATH